MEKKPPYNPNNKTELPLNHYLELFRAGNPEEMAERTGAAWDGGKFTLRICGEEKTVTWPGFSDPENDAFFCGKWGFVDPVRSSEFGVRSYVKFYGFTYCKSFGFNRFVGSIGFPITIKTR